MAAFDSTLGGSVATSYIDVTTADAYYLGTMQEAAWAALTTAEKEAALMAATSGLETLEYAGTRCAPSTDDPLLDQSLQWPRFGATCKGITAVCTMLPKEIVAATSFLALSLHMNPPSIGAPATGSTGAIQSQKLGDLSISYYDVREGASTKVDASAPLILQQYPILVDMLGCWSATSTGSASIATRVRS